MAGRIGRLLAAAGLLCGAAALHYAGRPSLERILLLWFLLAIGVGLLLPYQWTFQLAVLPWPAGVGLGLATGRYALLGGAWPLVWLASALAGALGITLGVIVWHGLKAPAKVRWLRTIEESGYFGRGRGRPPASKTTPRASRRES